MGAGYGIHRRGHIPTLAFWRYPEFVKVSLIIRRAWPNYGQDSWDADNEEIQNPPTTHLVATIDDPTDMLDYDSEDIDGMDDDARDDQEPAPTGHWKATSTNDVYMVDTPKGSDNEEQRYVAKDNSPDKQPKWRRKRRPKTGLDKNGTHTDPALE